MHIGVILHQHKFFGGGPRLALELAQSLKRMGHHVTLYTFRHVDDPEANYGDLAQGLSLIALPSNTDFKRKPLFGTFHLPGTNSIARYRQDIRLAKMLAARIDPATDALLPQSSRLNVMAAYYFKRLYKKQTPVVWQINDMPTLTFEVCFATSWTENSCSLPVRAWYGLLDRLTARYARAADEISVLSKINQAQALAEMRRRAEVVHIGVNAEQFAYVARNAPQGKKVRLLCHAQFFPHRRFEDAVEATALLVNRGYDVELTLSGDSETYREYRDYRDYVHGRALASGIADRVRFPGRLSEEAYVEELHRADIFILTNIRQSWSLALFEAIATGLPAVASREAGTTEILVDHTNALIANSKQPEDFARAIAELVDNHDLYQKISRNGATFVREVLTWDNYAKEILQLISKHASTN